MFINYYCYSEVQKPLKSTMKQLIYWFVFVNYTVFQFFSSNLAKSKQIWNGYYRYPKRVITKAQSDNTFEFRCCVSNSESLSLMCFDANMFSVLQEHEKMLKTQPTKPFVKMYVNCIIIQYNLFAFYKLQITESQNGSQTSVIETTQTLSSLNGAIQSD